MKFKNFKLVTTPSMMDAKCEDCKRDLETTSEETIWCCTSCDRLYTLVLRKVPKNQEKNYDIFL